MNKPHNLSFLMLLILSFTILFSKPAYCQQKILGIGIIERPISIEGERVLINQPEEEFLFALNLYTQANLDFVSGDCLENEVIKIEEGYTKIVATFFVDSYGKKTIPTAHWNYEDSGFVWTGYKSHSLQFYEEQNGFVSVRINKTRYWISLVELDHYGYRAAKWAMLFKGPSGLSMEVLYPMNLRKSPTVKSEKIRTVRTNRSQMGIEYHLISRTGKMEGKWIEVEVGFWREGRDPCSSDEPLEKLKGWMKFLDDKGFPNLFLNPSPCC